MRIRAIKPGFFRSEQLAELPPLTRLLFIGLWTLADSEGRLEDRPKRIKADVLPYDEWDVDSALQALHDHPDGFIVRYEVDGAKYIQISNFQKHQRLTGKEASARSEFPAPDGGDQSKQQSGTPENHGETTGKHPGNNREAPSCPGREGKGKEVVEARAREAATAVASEGELLSASRVRHEPHEDDAVIPTEGEVIAYGKSKDIPAGYCRYFYGKTDRNRMWLNQRGMLRKWREDLLHWWAKDRHEDPSKWAVYEAPKKPAKAAQDTTGWEEWLRNAYPDANPVKYFEMLPAEVRQEFFDSRKATA